MRFESIEIKNYRQYKELNFKFEEKKEGDLHIIVGSNGIGKSNILNAVAWCLYNEEPHLGDESSCLPRLNLEAKAEAKSKGEKTATVSVKIFATAEDELIIYERQMPVNVDTDFEISSELKVTVSSSSKDPEILEKGDAKEYIDYYMPERIREYFYFDGEQLHNYFIAEQNSKIKDSIHAVSQVDLLTKIKDRLVIIKNSKQSEAGKKNTDIGQLTSKESDLTKRKKILEGDQKEINEQIVQSKKIINYNTEYLKGQEDVFELEEKYEKLEEEHNEYSKVKIQLEKELYQFVREYKVILTLYPSARETLAKIKEKEIKGLLPPEIDKKLLEEMLVRNECSICGNKLDKDNKNQMRLLIQKLNLSSAASHKLVEIKSDLERVISDAKKYPEKKADLFRRLKNLDKKIEENEKETKKVDKRLSVFSDKEKIKNMHRQREEQKGLLEKNNKKLGAIEVNLKQLEDELSIVNSAIEKAISKRNEFAKLNEDIKFTKRAKEIVEAVEAEMMGEVREKIRVKTMDYFNQFIWKKNTYDHIELDDDYKLNLIHKDGYSCVGSCSAAERSLLALSFTLALHEVSGFNSLLFIDTPVARVSDVNRENFARVLSKVSGNKQIIMTFAPSEYSAEIRDIFEPVASTIIQLTTNDERITKYKRGYSE